MIPRRAAWMGVFLLLASVHAAGARPVLSIGGGVSATDIFLGTDTGPTPLGWIAARTEISDHWSAFMRVGYERPDAPWGSASGCENCPQTLDAERRATLVPASWGLRYSSITPETTQPFIEVAPTISWSRFASDLDVRYPDGHAAHEITTLERWLFGMEIGVGLSQALGPGAVMEWGFRYAYTATPRESDSILSLIAKRGGFSRVALTAGIAFGR